MSKQSEMYKQIADWRSSGLSQKAYCQEQGIKLATFSYWIKKQKDEQTSQNQEGFIPLKAASKNESYRIVYPNGVVLEASKGSSLSELQQLIQLFP